MMPTFTFENVTPVTLPAYCSLRSMQPLAEALAQMQTQLGTGQLRYEDLSTMHSERGLEAAFAVGKSRVVFPRVQADLDEAGLHALAEKLAQVAAGKRVILDELKTAPLLEAPWTRAGWTLADHSLLYTTDLKAGRWAFDTQIHERPVSELLSSALLALYRDLLSTDETLGDTGETDAQAAFADAASSQTQRLFVLLGEGQVVAAALLTPDARGAGIQMIGVTPAQRGRGLGRRLHAHLLATAQVQHERHVGATAADNVAMQRIFERNGSRLESEQKQFIHTTP